MEFINVLPNSPIVSSIDQLTIWLTFIYLVMMVVVAFLWVYFMKIGRDEMEKLKKERASKG